jgi:hypothetical protein
LPNEKQSPKELKVTDKRIFTPDGEIREEFQNEINPADPPVATASDSSHPHPAEPPPPSRPTPEPAPEPVQERRPERAPAQPPPGTDDRRQRSGAEKGTNPSTPFTNFIEPLIAQGYMYLGMLRNPYEPQAKIDTKAARQMIEILTLLRDKTRGNLDADEQEFLETHLGELKLAFVQRTKTI